MQVLEPTCTTNECCDMSKLQCLIIEVLACYVTIFIYYKRNVLID